MLGLDVDNDSAFINETFCADREIELTRSRAYKKNDQAWIEQKNGSVVRRLVGYGRLEGEGSATVLDELHQKARFYVNCFLPCLKLESNTRYGSKVTKEVRAAGHALRATAREHRVNETQKDALRSTFATLDPVRLLSDIRAFSIGSHSWKCRIATRTSMYPSKN